MMWFRNTRRSTYSTLRAIGREMISQWLTRTKARNDVQNRAAVPGGGVAWPEANATGVRLTGLRYTMFHPGGEDA
jgi:hypothetical protein